MSKNKLFYFLIWIITVGFIIHVIYTNFILDPQAADFLSHKTGSKKTVNIPVWLTVMNIHVVFACLAMVTGAVNFSTALLSKRRTFHRSNGYVYLASVMIVDFTSGYMAPYATGGKITSMAFNLLNIIWLVMTVTAIVQIRKKRVDSHRRWMVRSYAFCFTNLCIHLITFAFQHGLSLSYPVSYTIGVYGSIIVLLAMAEVVIRVMRAVPFKPRP